MIIKRLTMFNFGVYAGTNTFNFSCEKPVVLIGGMNGRGKTTFLEGILLALYGINSNAYKESTYKSYGQYLRSHINKNNGNSESRIELEFVMNDRGSEEYLIRREWNSNSKTTREKITVFENGTENQFLTKNWPMFIENVLPSALSAFYFFDGEKIAELAVDDTDAQMKDSIRAMLGINVLDVLKNDLNRSLKSKSKDTKNVSQTDPIDNMRQRCSGLSEKIGHTDANINICLEKIQKKKEKIDELREKYETKGGSVVKQRHDLMERRSDLQAAIEQNDSRLIEIASSELPLVLVKDLIQSIKLQAVEEHDSFVMAQVMEQIEEIFNEYTQLYPEYRKENTLFVEYVKQQSSIHTEKEVYGLSDQALFQINALLEGLMLKSKETAAEYLNKKYYLKKELDNVESHLSLDINEKELGEIYSQIKLNEDKLVSLEISLAKLEQERSSLNSELNSKTGELNRMIEEYLANAEVRDDSERMKKYTMIALKVIDSYTERLQKQKTDKLGITVSECYKKLANKKTMIKKIVMNPATLDIGYIDNNDMEVLKNSLSAGEKQLMVVAILWALAICSKKKLPVIIDTPLARLDSMHREALITAYFPNASNQTIILSTDSEIDKKGYALMKDYIGDEFTLNYSEKTRSTTIEKGYFQK